MREYVHPEVPSHFPIYIYIEVLLPGVRTPMCSIPHIHGYYSALSFLIYLINYFNIPQYNKYQKNLIEVLSFFNIPFVRTEKQYMCK